MTSVMINAATRIATLALIVVMTISTDLRLNRSVMVPAKGEITTAVTPRTKPTAPTWNAEPVRLKTRYPCAANWIHWPSIVPTLPIQRTRKSGMRSV